MAHARTAIRAAIVTALTGLTTTGARVFGERTYPKSDANLPCLQVMTGDEPEIIEGLSATPILERRMQLLVRCVAKANMPTLDTTLDNMLAEVEVAMNSAGTLSGKVKDISAPKSIEYGGDDSLEKPVGIAQIIFEVIYFTKAGTPGTSI